MNNIITNNISLALDLLFLKHPTRTSFGLILGLATRVIFKVLSIWMPMLAVIVNTLNYWEFTILGIFIAHIATARDAIFGRCNHLSENEEKAFAMIRELKISDFYKQNMYLKVVEKVLEKVELNPEIQEEIFRRYI